MAYLSPCFLTTEDFEPNVLYGTLISNVAMAFNPMRVSEHVKYVCVCMRVCMHAYVPICLLYH